MQNFRKRIVKVMKESLPAQVVSRLPKANDVVVQRSPANKQKVAVWPFQAPLEFQRYESGHPGYYRLRLREGRFEIGFVSL